MPWGMPREVGAAPARRVPVRRDMGALPPHSLVKLARGGTSVNVLRNEGRTRMGAALAMTENSHVHAGR